MDIDVDNRVIVTREFEWSVEKLKNYLVSNVFEIFLPENTTKWLVEEVLDISIIIAF